MKYIMRGMGQNPQRIVAVNVVTVRRVALSHYLAWVVDQSAWQKPFRKQIKTIYPSEPNRILVVDDLFGGYRTGYATLALLDALYPQAKISMYAGDDDLTSELVTGWLEVLVPNSRKRSEIWELQFNKGSFW